MAALMMSCVDTTNQSFLLVVGGSPLKGLMKPRTRETFHGLLLRCESPLRVALSQSGRRSGWELNGASISPPGCLLAVVSVEDVLQPGEDGHSGH